jgi:hypothetical protein
MLQELDVDAATLLKACAGESQLIRLPRCLRDGTQQKSDARLCHREPDLYVSMNGCRKWVWASFESAAIDEWSGYRRRDGRVTNSDAVAEAECELSTRMLAGHHNLETLSNFHKHALSRVPRGIELFLHPGSGPMVGTHAGVLQAMQSPQTRDWTAIKARCTAGGWNDMMRFASTPIAQDTNSERHLALRKLAPRTPTPRARSHTEHSK